MSDTLITVLNYGSGNIGSVLNMIRYVGGHAVVAESPVELLKAEKILLPGVGSFDNAMTRLKGLGLVEPLKERVAVGIPVLGICLGMQLLAESSEEGDMAGLGLIPGVVRRIRLRDDTNKLKVPHMGWNHAIPVRHHPLVESLEDLARYYFVHSYFFDCACSEDILLRTKYGNEFTSGVHRENVVGVQFHPEKSHRYGMQLIRNFVGY